MNDGARECDCRVTRNGAAEQRVIVRAAVATLFACAIWIVAGCGAATKPAQLDELGSRVAAGHDTHPTASAPSPAPAALGLHSPYAIAAGPDGVWFTEYGAAVVGELAPGRALKRITVDPGGFPERLAISPDGAIWFTDPEANRIGRLSPVRRSLDYFNVPTARSGPAGIAIAPDGTIWFTEHAADKIAELVPPGAAGATLGHRGFKEFALLRGGGPAGIVAARDGDLWFAENSGNRIGRIVIPPGSHNPIIAEYELPVLDSSPNGLAVGGDGNVYFTELAASRIGRITPQGRISEMVLPVNGPALDITGAPDGTIWMTVPSAHAVCHLRPGNPITAYFLPDVTVPAFLAGAADGDLYFTEPGGKVTQQGDASR
jgi:virginiamycin B lyase